MNRFRSVVWMTVLMLLLQGPALAMKPIDADAIFEAQQYGKQGAKMVLADFLGPWTAYEEKAVALDTTAERAYLYTPFLLLAANARDKTLKAQPVSLEDSQPILIDYAGMLSFSAVLLGRTPQFAQKMNVRLLQDKKEIAVYQSNTPAQAEKSAAANGSGELFYAQCYFYFLEKNVDLTKPLVLSITTTDNTERRFFFDLVKMQ